MVVRYDPNTEKLIVQEANRLEYTQCQLWLKRHIKGYKFNPIVKMGAWDGQIDFFNNGQVNFGLWKEMVKAMKEIGSNFVVENKEDFPLDRQVTLESVQDFCDEFFKGYKAKNDKGELVEFTPRDYQVESAFKILKNKMALLQVATSGGKTLIMSIIIFYILKNINPDAKFLVIVPAISLVTQFYDAITEFNTNFGTQEAQCDLRIEEIMSDKPRKFSGAKDPNIYISCYQSIVEWDRSWFEKFEAVMIDESHLAKAKSLTTILEKTFTTAKYRFGVSGTFPDEMSCEILTIQAVTGPIMHDISAKKLIDEGSISPLDIKIMYLNHNDKSFDTILRTVRRNPNRAIEAYQAEKEYVQKSKSRKDFVKKLVSKCTKNTLLLFNSIEFGKGLFEEISKEQTDKKFFYIDGEVSAKERELIKKEMEISDESIRILFGSFGTLSTGISIKNIYNIIFMESFKSESRIIQSIGRGLRLHASGKVANIFDLVDQFIEEEPRNAFFKHGEERKKMYKKHTYPYKEIKFNL